MNQLIIKVANQNYFGEYVNGKDSKTIKNAIQISGQTLTVADYKKYLTTKNLKELVEVNIQGNSAFQTQKLTQEQINFCKNEDAVFAECTTKALPNLVNTYYIEQ